MQISSAVTAQLISTFVFTTQIVQSLYFLKPKFQASSHLLWLYSSACVGPGGMCMKAHLFLFIWSDVKYEKLKIIAIFG